MKDIIPNNKTRNTHKHVMPKSPSELWKKYFHSLLMGWRSGNLSPWNQPNIHS